MGPTQSVLSAPDTPGRVEFNDKNDNCDDGSTFSFVRIHESSDNDDHSIRVVNVHKEDGRMEYAKGDATFMTGECCDTAKGNKDGEVAQVAESSPRQVCYFNNASKTALPPSVHEAGAKSLSCQTRPWRCHRDKNDNPDNDDCAGDSESDDDLSVIRELFSTLIGCENRDGSDIAIAPSTASAMTMVAANLERAGKIRSESRIVVLQDEMNSAIYCWQHVCARVGAVLDVIPYPHSNKKNQSQSDGEGWTEQVIERINSTDIDVSVVCVPQVHWSDGSLLDLERIGLACRRQRRRREGDDEIALVIDATQSLGVMPFDVRTINPDAVAASAHKWLLGPVGLSLVYVAERHHDTWMPLDQHGRARACMVDDSHWEARPNQLTPMGYPKAFAKGARRLDCGGKPNPILLPMIRAGLEIVVSYDLAAVQEKLKVLTSAVWERAEQMGFRVTPGPRGGHIIGLRPGCQLNRITPEVMVTIASKLEKKRIYLSVRCGAFRIAPYLNNTLDDVKILMDALAEECATIL